MGVKPVAFKILCRLAAVLAVVLQPDLVGAAVEAQTKSTQGQLHKQRDYPDQYTNGPDEGSTGFESASDDVDSIDIRSVQVRPGHRRWKRLIRSSAAPTRGRSWWRHTDSRFEDDDQHVDPVDDEAAAEPAEEVLDVVADDQTRPTSASGLTLGSARKRRRMRHFSGLRESARSSRQSSRSKGRHRHNPYHRARRELEPQEQKQQDQQQPPQEDDGTDGQAAQGIAVSPQVDATWAATQATVTAAKVAASMPDTLPPKVREAALKAAAEAAAQAILTPTVSASDSRPAAPASESQAVAANRQSQAGSPGGAGKLLYIGIFSGLADFENREAVRQGWLSLVQKASFPGEAHAEFVVGSRRVRPQVKGTSLVIGANGVADPEDEDQLAAMLGRESAEHGDLFHVPYDESAVTVLMFLARAVEAGYRFVMKVDIQQRLMVTPLISSLRKDFDADQDVDLFLYAGQTLKEGTSLLTAESRKPGKYFASSCYLLSRSLAQRISQDHLDHSLMLWSYNTNGHDVDDIDMGQWVAFENELLDESRMTPTGEMAQATAVPPHVDYHPIDVCRPFFAPGHQGMDQ